MIVLISILLTLAVIGLAAGAYFLWEINYCRERSTGFVESKLSVIIPARNEEKNIVDLLDSLHEQGRTPFEIIVVDDNSTDRTKQVALDKGAKVVDAGKLPKGWTGKNWACHQGMKASSGEFLLFLDADTRLEKNGLSRIVGAYESNEGVISICPYHRVVKLYEDLSLFFNILMLAGMNAFTIKGNKKMEKGLFGQCIMLSKRDYRRSGGHEAVKDRILENFFLARRFQEAGIRISCYGGKDTISMRMYPQGPGELIGGWGKAFASGAGNTPPNILFSSILWISSGIISFVLPLYALCKDLPGPTLILTITVYVLFGAQLFWMMKRIGSFSFLCALLYPIYMIFYNAVFVVSLISLIFKRKVKWKGRDVDQAA